jgi:CheY-like chemotaxis protein
MNRAAVLCIEDCPQALELRGATLEPCGYAVRVATSGYSGMKVLEETSVAVVLLEYKLEGIDAEAVALHLKQRYPSLPIILLSAFSEMPGRMLWRVDEYLLKSASLEELAGVIDRLIVSSNDRNIRSAAA